MKRVLSLLLAVTLLFSVNTFAVLAEDNPNFILHIEDFNDYVGESTLPDGWSWTATAAEGVVNDTNPVISGYGNDTALKIKSDNHSSSYTLKRSISSVDITKGIVKLSFQVNFEHIASSNVAYTQTFSIYGGNTNGPYIKGLSIVNGKVRYYSGDTAAGRWNAKYTTAYIEAGKWYNFDVISDYDNNKTTYYMNGEPLYDEATGELIETASTFSDGNSPTAAAQLLIGARTKHENADDGGDIWVDNITVSSSIASGAYSAHGEELFENPEKLDIKFNNTVRLQDFKEDEITVNAYLADDIMMKNGTPVDFTMGNFTSSGCELVFDSEVMLDDYDKLKVDFGSSTDMLGGKLSSVALIKMPEVQQEIAEEVIYDSDNLDASLAEITMSKASVSDYEYELNGENKTADFYTTTTEGGNANIGFVMKDGSDIFVPGSEYQMSFKIKPIETNYWSDTANVPTRDFNFRGIFDTVRNEDGSLRTNEGALRWFYMSNRYRSIGYHSGNSDKVTAFGFDYKYNSNTAVNSDVDALFAANNWVDVVIDYNPDNKTCSIAVEGTGSNGQALSGGEENYPRFLSNKALSSTYKAAYPNIDTNLIDGTLRTIGFVAPANGARFMVDDMKITKREIPKSTALIKYIVLKNEKGTVVQSTDEEVNAGANKIEIHFDGTVDEEKAEEISVSGNEPLSYSTEYDVLNKVVTVDFFDTLLTKGEYSISIPEELNISEGLTNIDFKIGEGDIEFSSPSVNTGSSTALAYTEVKNTSSTAKDSVALVVASYNNGALVDVNFADVIAEKGIYRNISTEMITTENADTVKAFIIRKDDLVHLADYTEKKIANKSSEETDFEYNYSGDVDGKYVTAVLMNPDADNKYESYTLDDICTADAASYIDVINNDNGSYSFGFDITGKSGKYTLYVITEHGTVVDKEEILYSDSEDRTIAQNLVISAVEENETSAELLEVISDNAIELGLVNLDLFEDIDKSYLADMLYTSVKANAVDTENTKDIYERVANVCLIDALNDSKIDDIGKYTKDAAVFDKEPVKTWYFKDLADSKNITERLLDKDITSEDDLSAKLMEALALEIINEGNGYLYVKDICELLKDEIDIDTSNGTSSVYRAIDGKDYDSYADLKDDFDKLTDDDDDGGSGSGSGGSSKRSSSGGSGSVLASPVVTPEPLKEYVFSDIAEYDWAVDSITELYKNNIVSGKDGKNFAPGDKVLREEFVKMIVEAFKIKGTTDTEFKDVSENDWFKPYIETAFGAGVVNGEGENFGVGKSITRQDMAKIIYQAALNAGIKIGTSDISVFKDADKIASYASDAVSALYKSGVINGRGDGIFAPQDFATRAEAAVIISRAMALIK